MTPRPADPPADREHPQSLARERGILFEHRPLGRRVEPAQWYDLLRRSLDECDPAAVLADHVMHAVAALEQASPGPALAQLREIDAGATGSLDECALGRAAGELEPARRRLL